MIRPSLVRSVCFEFSLLFLCACGTNAPTIDAGAPGSDAGVADAGPPDAGALIDAGVTVDAGVDAGTDAGQRDAGAISDAGIVVDAGSLGLSRVQCRTSSGCPGTSTCTTTAPGGVCNGCASDGDCPSGTTCGSFAACVRDCQRDSDCGGALRCTTQGLCGIRACSSATPCPAPYVCGPTNFCQRPSCDGGCPASLTCSGVVCVEP